MLLLVDMSSQEQVSSFYLGNLKTPTVQNPKLHKLQIIMNPAALRTPNLFEGTTLPYRLGMGSHFQSLSYIAREST